MKEPNDISWVRIYTRLPEEVGVRFGMMCEERRISKPLAIQDAIERWMATDIKEGGGLSQSAQGV